MMAIGIQFAFDFVPFLILLYLAGEIYFRNRSNLTNRSAALLLMAASMMFLGEWLIASLPLEYASAIGCIFKYGGAYILMSASVNFFIRLSGFRWRKVWVVLPSCLPLAAFAVILLLPDVFSLHYVESGSFKKEYGSAALKTITKLISFYTIISALGILLIARTRISYYMKLARSEGKKFKHILYTTLFCIAWVGVFLAIPNSNYLSFNVFRTQILPMYGVLIWAFLLRYAMIKFNILPAAERKYQILFRLSKHGIVMLDRHARIVEVNPAFERMMGLGEPDLKGTFFDMHLVAAEQEQFRQQYHKHFRELHPIRRELSIADSTEQELIMEAESEFLVFADEVLQYVVLRNITERKRNEERMRHMAYHDDLTDLANRHLFQQRIEHALREVGSNAPMAAVLLLDLDRFKLINDTLGHAAGDTMLLNIADKLRSCCDSGATIARLGGDEFAILLPAIPAAETAVKTADQLMEVLHAPIPLEGQEFFVTVSIGISVAPEDGMTPAELLRNADTAMYASKQSGRNMYSRFSTKWNETNEHSLSVVNGLRHALERGEFLLFYQPQVCMATGAVIGAEALIRWQHPTRGIISPGDFIQLAEETGLIVPIGDWVLETALRHWMHWSELGMSPMQLSVNLSPKQVLTGRFVERLIELLTTTGFPPDLLCLEVTESIAIHDTGLALQVCRSIRELGVRLAVDDFGIGYSSLSALHRFPFTSLKLDRSFISAIGQQDNNGTILKAMLDLASGLKLDVVAEGVETPEQWKLLQELGCEAVQGYLFSRPLPLSEFERFMNGSGRAIGVMG